MISASEVKVNIDIVNLIGQDTLLKRVARTGGGEYAGPCPFCGGEDRFRVQIQAPAGKKPEGPRWMCRQCSPKWGDVIGYVMKRDSLDFQEALQLLVELCNLPQHKIKESLEIHDYDKAQWISTAFDFLEECIEHLWNDSGKSALNWLHDRGLNDDTLRLWNVGYNPVDGYGEPEQWGLLSTDKIYIPKGIVIPCQDASGFHYLKIRRRVSKSKYIQIKGSEQWPFGLQTYRNVSTAFLFEGEFDVMLAYQTGFTGVGYAALPAGQEIRSDYLAFFEPVSDVIVAYDNDDPGQVAAVQLCRIPNFHKGTPFPYGNDLTEYHQSGGDVFEWLYDQIELLNGREVTNNEIEFQHVNNREVDVQEKEIANPRYVLRDAVYALQPQPPLEWIIEDLISAGSVSVFYGEPGSKKTYSMLSLAVCVALGKPWLGFFVKPCKVLVIDEESGERRLALRLGAAIRGELGDESTPLNFISLAGFKLDNNTDPEELKSLFEETGAELVIIDALADVMDGDENTKKDTQPVFTTFRKLAETTGAAIIVIHHSNKQGGYRGSSAIKGASDLMVKIESKDDSNWIVFKTEKTRDGVATSFTAVATWTEDQFYLTEADSIVKEKPLNRSQKYVIRYLKEHGASPLPEIMGAADVCKPNTAKNAVYSLVETGVVYRTNPDDAGPGVEAVYDLAKEGQENSESTD